MVTVGVWDCICCMMSQVNKGQFGNSFSLRFPFSFPVNILTTHSGVLYLIYSLQTIHTCALLNDFQFLFPSNCRTHHETQWGTVTHRNLALFPGSPAREPWERGCETQWHIITHETNLHRHHRNIRRHHGDIIRHDTTRKYHNTTVMANC